MPQGAEGQGDFIPLRDGEILVGEIASHTEDGLEVKRLDNGGVVRLRWGQLAPPFEKDLKAKLGYTYEVQDEITVDADEITLRDGTKRVGLIVSQSPEKIILKDAKSSLTYERGVLAGAPTRVTAPALDIYTKDELYTEKVSAVDLTTAEGNMTLARYLEQIFDFARAIQHWNDVKRIDAGFHPGEVTQALARLEEKKARQDEFDFLQDIERERAMRHYDKAIAMCDEFQKKFARSSASTRADVEKRKKNIEGARHADRVALVCKEYHRQAELLCHGKADDRKSTLDAARSWSTSDLPREIIKNAVLTLQKNWKELTEAEFVKYWKERGKLSKTRSVSYGSGSFILGKGGVTKGFDMKSPQKPTSGDPAVEAMIKKMQELLKKQSGGMAGAPQQQKLDPPEDWWQNKAQNFERYQFILANFVEFGGEMEVVSFFGRPCIQCGGLGGVPVASTGGQQPGGVTVGGRSGNQPNQNGGATTTMLECPTCHGTSYQRSIYYR
jgi:hypothetical protein